MSDNTDDNMDGEPEGLDPVLAAILRALWEHAQTEGGKDLSLARLSKRAGVHMSVLRRVLTQLADAELAVMTLEEDGRGSARLTDEGEALCGQLFDEDGGQMLH
jgi:hypothetical protein